MENKEADFDVDFEEKENSVFNVKKPKKIWMPGNNYFRIFIYVAVVVIIFLIFFVLYNKEWFGLSNTVNKNYFSILQSEDKYDCKDKYDEAESLKPISFTEIDIETKRLTAVGESLKEQKTILEEQKIKLTDTLSFTIYKSNLDEYTSKLAIYNIELQKHKKNIEEYNQKVQAYYNFLKGNCTLVK
jgi:hypothetical protein